MSDSIIAQYAPYLQETEPGTYYWCACGRSAHQPFCDGSHQGTGCTPLEVKIEQKKRVAWCGCKRTGTSPFCDGTHAKLLQTDSDRSERGIAGG